ncbi:alpha/beta hydrolase [Halalkalibaculum sp. DA3122]|uniref:alpha/beta hydrolase n=1 Tax=Halalkalibaculum sp. DA3122 TaxID=3373607 RepID=UPI00375407D3
MRKKSFRYSAYILVIVSAIFFGGRSFLYYTLEEEAIATRPNGSETPEQFGAPSEQFVFESHGRTLHASVVHAEEADSTTPAVLLYHGRRETISRWAEVQALLYQHGITSMVFDYSGFGNSSGEPSIENLHNDGIAAWQHFVEHVARSGQPKIALGHSLGTGILMSGVDQLNPSPSLVVLSAPWSTARSAVIHLGMAPEEIYYLLPDVWNNVEAAKNARNMEIPLLVVHGTEDRIVPIEMGREVAAAGEGQFIPLEGYGHREIARRPTTELWSPVLEAIQAHRN